MSAKAKCPFCDRYNYDSYHSQGCEHYVCIHGDCIQFQNITTGWLGLPDLQIAMVPLEPSN